jgi:hypothetical protein
VRSLPSAEEKKNGKERNLTPIKTQRFVRCFLSLNEKKKNFEGKICRKHRQKKNKTKQQQQQKRRRGTKEMQGAPVLVLSKCCCSPRQVVCTTAHGVFFSFLSLFLADANMKQEKGRKAQKSNIAAGRVCFFSFHLSLFFFSFGALFFSLLLGKRRHQSAFAVCRNAEELKKKVPLFCAGSLRDCSNLPGSKSNVENGHGRDGWHCHYERRKCHFARN